MDQQLLSSLGGQDHWCKPWAYMDCPASGLQVFMLTSIGRPGGRIVRLFKRQQVYQRQEAEIQRGNSTWMSPDQRSATQIRQSARGEDVIGFSPVVGAAIFMAVRYRVHGLFLTSILFCWSRDVHRCVDVLAGDSS